MDGGPRPQGLLVCPRENATPGGCTTGDSECEFTRSVRPLRRIKETLWAKKNWLMCPSLSLPLGMPLWFSSIQETSSKKVWTSDNSMALMAWQSQPRKEPLVPLLDANELCECLFHGGTLMDYTSLGSDMFLVLLQSPCLPTLLPSVSCRILFPYLLSCGGGGLDPPKHVGGYVSK